MSDMDPSDASEARYLGNSEDDEDKSDDDAPPPEDDDDEELPVKKQQNISQFYGAASSKGGKATVRAKSKLLELQASDDESESEVPTRNIVRKPLKIPTVAADPFEEHDQLRREYANGAPAKEDDVEVVVPKVTTVTDVLLLKNDKGPATKRFFAIDAAQSALHAPNYHGTAKCPLTMTCTALLQSRKDREAMFLAAAADPETLELMVRAPIQPRFLCTNNPAGKAAHDL